MLQILWGVYSCALPNSFCWAKKSLIWFLLILVITCFWGWFGKNQPDLARVISITFLNTKEWFYPTKMHSILWHIYKEIDFKNSNSFISLSRYGAKDGHSPMVECTSCGSNIPEWYGYKFIIFYIIISLNFKSRNRNQNHERMTGSEKNSSMNFQVS